MSWEDVPGHVESRESHGETTIVVEAETLVEACTYLRDEEGFNFLSDITPTDYLGWGERGIAGYYGTASGRDLDALGAQGLARSPQPTTSAGAQRVSPVTSARHAAAT